MKHLLKTKVYAFCLCAVLTLTALAMPPGVLSAAEGMDSGKNPTNTTSIDVVVKFMAAAMVRFEHDTFVMPEKDDVINAANLRFVQKANITVNGASGETAQVKCEIQQIDYSVIETFKPVKRQKCAEFGQSEKIVLTGRQSENDVDLDRSEQNLIDRQSFVSLEISYI